MSNASNHGPYDLNAYSDDILRLAKLSPEECEKELAAVAEKHGVSPSILRTRVRATITANKKQQKQQEKDERKKAAKQAGYLYDKEGHVIANMANVMTLHNNHPDVKDMLYWDLFGNRPMVMHPIGKPEQHTLLIYADDAKREFPRWFNDQDYLDLLEWTQRQPDFEFVNLTILKQAVEKRMRLVQRNPVMEWLASQKWDGKRRIGKALINYFGARRERYSVAASRLLMLSIVARIMWPGCKQDYALAFKGGQGILKSAGARTLAIKDEYFIDCLPDLDTRDAMVMMEGKIIAELAEHVAANKHDAATAKGALSRQRNEYVQKYEKWRVSVPRTVTFLSTTNEFQMLADQTGNRRWAPVDVCETCEQIDVAGLKADLPQLYAEAYALLKKGAQYWPTPWAEQHYFEEQQEKRRIEPNWEPIFKEYMCSIDGFGGVDVLATPGIGISTAALSLFFENCERFKAVPSGQWKNALERMGWECGHHRVKGHERKQFRLWAHKDSGDTLDATISWEPKSEFSRGRWRRDDVGVNSATELDADVYFYELARLERELAELKAKKPNFG